MPSVWNPGNGGCCGGTGVNQSYTSNDVGLVGDGLTDNTIKIVLAAQLSAASGIPIQMYPGVYVFDAVSFPSGSMFTAVMAGTVTFKRKAASIITGWVAFNGVNGCQFSNIIFDGNASQETVGANSVALTNTYNLKFKNCSFINAKAAAGYGTGVNISSTLDYVNNTYTEFTDCAFNNNQGIGAAFQTANNITFKGGCAIGNTGGGISGSNYPVSPNVNTVMYGIKIQGMRVEFNGSAGIGIGGYYASIVNGNYVFSNQVYPAWGVEITGNTVTKNGQYGIVCQGRGILCSDNYITDSANAANSFAGGVLFNAYNSRLANNIIVNSYTYGVDAGGCNYCQISGNIIDGTTNPTGGTGLNVGGSFGCKVDNNTVTNVSGTSIAALTLEGSGGALGSFPQQLTALEISNNKIYVPTAASIGVWVFGNAAITSHIIVHDNNVYGLTDANKGYILAVGNIKCYRNESGATIGPLPINNAATLVIPDYGDVFQIIGAGTITSIQTFSQNACTLTGIGGIQLTNAGTGYTSPPAVSFTGGGGTGAAATAQCNGDGTVTGFQMTAAGTGYTSVPTVVLTGGGGTGAAGTAVIGINNQAGREITLISGSGMTINRGSNLVFPTANTTVAVNGVVKLIGTFLGQWTLVSSFNGS